MSYLGFAQPCGTIRAVSPLPSSPLCYSALDWSKQTCYVMTMSGVVWYGVVLFDKSFYDVTSTFSGTTTTQHKKLKIVLFQQSVGWALREQYYIDSPLSSNHKRKLCCHLLLLL